MTYHGRYKSLVEVASSGSHNDSTPPSFPVFLSKSFRLVVYFFHFYSFEHLTCVIESTHIAYHLAGSTGCRDPWRYQCAEAFLMMYTHKENKYPVYGLLYLRGLTLTHT
jgi:hypothetical protein